MNAVEKKFLEHCQKRKLFSRSERVLLALSGGADSVALLCLLSAIQPVLKLTLAAAHCNFGLRGTASDGDETFCKKLCAKRNIPLFLARFETKRIAAERKTSLEETARNLRYAYFEEIAETHNFTKITTAHHADDNVETILFNLSRGSSILGLSGIAEQRGSIVRPMLYLSRTDILDYLKSKRQRYRTDASNFSDDFDRNFIRLRVIPLLEKRFKHKLSANLLRLAANVTELAAFLDEHLEQLAQKKTLDLAQGRFQVADLKSLTPFEQKELFKRALKRFSIEPNATLLGDLVHLLQTQSGRKIVVSPALQVHWKGKEILFVKT